MYGRIEPNSHIVLCIKFIANTQPLIFKERIKISVRELIKGAIKKHHHKPPFRIEECDGVYKDYSK